MMSELEMAKQEPSSSRRSPRRLVSSQQQTPKVLRWYDGEEDGDSNVNEQSTRQQPQRPQRSSKTIAFRAKNAMLKNGKTNHQTNGQLMVVPTNTIKRKKIPPVALSRPFSSNRLPPSLSSTASLLASRMSLWVDKYAPVDSKSLCVAPKKVKEIKSWMEQYVTSMTTMAAVSRDHTTASSTMSKMLILVGSPGIGKSTMIRVLAKELKLHVHEWTDVVVAASSYYYDRGEDSIETMSLLQSLQEFLQKSGAGYQSLFIKPTAAITTTTLNQTEQKQRQATVVIDKKRGMKRKTPGLFQGDDNNTTITTNAGSIIVLDELPNLANADMEARFCDIMTQHLLTTQVPTILIYSHVREGKHKPDDLERLIDPQLLYHPSMVQITQIHAVTKPKLKNILENIARQERLGSTSSGVILNWDELHLQCQGDVRHAIMSLQFEHAADLTATGARSSRASVTSRNNHSHLQMAQHQQHHHHHRSERDVSLSTFHALGKLLYAKKRIITNGHDGVTTTDQRLDEIPKEVLDFDPEAVMEHAGMELFGSLTFLEYHCPEFFTDMTDLSDILSLYSDAATLLDSNFQSDRTIFPNAYVGSVAGRAVAYCNHYPAPSKFRQFSSPKVFEVIRRRRQNMNSMGVLCQRLSQQEFISVAEIVTAGSTFVKDHIPYLRFIIPEEVNVTLGNLHSHVNSVATTRKANISRTNDTEQAHMEQYAKEQEAILELDDISDSDDDGRETTSTRTETR